MATLINWSADSQGKIFEFGPGWFEFSGLHPNGKESLDWVSLVPRQHRSQLEETWKASIRTQSSFQFRLQLRDSWFKACGTPQPDPDGKVLGYQGFFFNISDEMHDLEKSRNREQKNSNALKSARVAHWDLDLETNDIEYIDDPAGIFGDRLSQIPKLDTFMSIVHSDDKDEILKALEKAKNETGYFQTEFRVIWADGSTHWLLGKGRTIRDQNNRLHLIGFNLDITDKKSAESEVKDLENQLAATFNQAAVGIAHVSPEGKLIRVNAKFAEFTGYSQKELESKTFQDITHPDDLKIDLDLVHQVLESKISYYTLEKRYIRKNGSIVWVNLSVALVRHLDGTPNYFISVIEDISDIKEDQLAIKELTNELEIRVKNRTKELEEINTELEHFLYMISQNIKEPVHRIKLNIDLIQEEIQHLINSTIKKHFDDIVNSSSSLNQMAQNLLGLSRIKRGELNFNLFNLNEAVEAAIHGLKDTPGVEGIVFEVEELGDVYGNKTLLCQLYQNLIKNSLVQQKGLKQLYIEIGKRMINEEEIFYFKDNTRGISASEMHRILLTAGASDSEAHFNLFLCKSIIKRHKGSIWVEEDRSGDNMILFSLSLLP